jgi:PAS domain-containing protein
MDQRDRLFDLLNVLYAAPGTEDGWLVFLDSVCAAIDATGASFISVNPLGRANVAVSARTDPAALSEYAAHWGAVDPWGSSARLRDINPGEVVLGSGLIGWSALTRTEYYNGFGRRYDIVRSLVGVVERGPSATSVIALNGTERRGEFSEDDTRLLALLMPHVQRALQLHRRLLDSDARIGQVTAAMDASPHGVILVRANGMVTFMNRAAERLRSTGRPHARVGRASGDTRQRHAGASDTDRCGSRDHRGAERSPWQRRGAASPFIPAPLHGRRGTLLSGVEIPGASTAARSSSFRIPIACRSIRRSRARSGD